MTAKQYLRQLSDLDDLINQELRDIENLQKKRTCLRGISYDQDRVQTSPKGEAPFVHEIEKLADLEERIREDVQKYTDLKHTIIIQINGLENKTFVKILYRRYVVGESLCKIAADLDYSYDRVKHLHGYALKAFEYKYNIK